jgi:transposase InsO family protein
MLYNHAGQAQPLKDVLYIPSFNVNLISLSKADANGFHGRWGRGSLTVEHPSGKVLLRSYLRGGLYHAECSARRFTTPSVSVAASRPDAILVHRRFGHVGLSTLSKMSRNDVVSNLPPASEFDAALKKPSVCGACQEGGQKQVSFPRTPTSSKTVVPYAKLHVDIAGPRTKSLGGSQYFTVVVDEATQFIWVFTHRTKDQSADHLMEKISFFIADGHRVKAIRTDRDAVFMSTKFQSFLKSHHIQHQPTSGRTPQENGRSERAVGVLKERMQCLLSDSGLRDNMWAEAIWHAAYLQNISSSTGSTTPWELIKGDKPDAGQLRVWGCKAWKVIPADQRQKSFDTRKSEQVRFVGIAWPNVKAYRVLTARGRIETSRHVVFDESAPPACDTRADFSSHIQTEVSVPQSSTQLTPTPQAAPPSTPVVAQSIPMQPAPTLSPVDTAGTTAEDQPDMHAPPILINSSPLFETEATDPPPEAAEPPMAPPMPSSNLPRRSARPNKNVPPAMYDPSAYTKYAQGLPKRKVSFADAAVFQQ